MITRKPVDLSIERRIVMGCIISTDFIEEVASFVQPYHLQNEFAKKVVRWCMDYYEGYKKAPEKHIQIIYESKKNGMSPADAEIVENLLATLSDQYEKSVPFNIPYVVDQTERYCKRRELDIRSTNVQALLLQDQVEEAEEQMTTYKQVAKATSGWFNPLDNVQEVFREDHSDVILRMPGQVGELLGQLERGWLVSIFAPFKRGKTWWMQEFAIIALMSGLKVAFVSLEMKRKNQKERIFKRLTAFAEDESAFIYPTFDCVRNQSGECDMHRRRNVHTLLDDSGNRPEFSPVSPYRPCVECRLEGLRDYEPTTWFEIIRRPSFELFRVKKGIKQFKNTFGDNLRVKVYPKFSVNISQMERDLNLLEQTEDFIPDVIIPDYAGIFAPEDTRETGVQRADTTWKTLAGLADKREVLIVTGSQGNRGSIYKRDTQQDDIAEWIGQLAHVDVMMALNQTGLEKREGKMRISLLVHRHREFHENEQATVLQNLRLGQVHLDSEKGE
jgi:hypothetical protein